MAEKLFKNTRFGDKSAMKKHVVKKGETLNKIAEKYGTSAKELAKVNKIADIDAIKEDQVLLIPNVKEGEKKPKYVFTKAEK